MTERPAHCALFDGISREDCGTMFDCFGAREVSYRAGQLICEFDGTQDSVGVLLSGSAELLRLDADGNRTLLEALSEGGVFGEVLAFSGAPGDSAFLECRQDCRVLYLRYDQITKRCENACARHSRLVQNFMRLLSQKTLLLSRRVEVLSRRSIREKLLCYFGQQAAGQTSFTLPVSLSALAEYIGADRSAMMRELKKLRDEGIVRTDGRRVTLMQPHSIV